MKLLTAIFTLLLMLAPAAVCAQQEGTAPSQTIQIKRSGSQPSQKAPATHFTGSVRLQPLFDAAAPARAHGGLVTFDPGARTDWHTHTLGQTLILTEGTGRVQQWGGAITEMRKGDVISIPPGVKHWHGATPTTAMTHIAIVEELNGKSTDWLEKVSDAQYGVAPPTTQGTKDMSKEPSRAQQLMGDVAPKLAELTDDVLFGDVWARPGLSQRDRSLITVAALIAGGNTEQLTSHLSRAKTNGVTQAEAAEVITHLAFYAGWPRAISAVAIARKVFETEPAKGEEK